MMTTQPDHSGAWKGIEETWSQVRLGLMLAFRGVDTFRFMFTEDEVIQLASICLKQNWSAEKITQGFLIWIEEQRKQLALGA